MKIKCCLCGKEIEEENSNNAYPVVKKGRCCDKCNTDKVIPSRIALLYAKEFFNNGNK